MKSMRKIFLTLYSLMMLGILWVVVCPWVRARCGGGKADFLLQPELALPLGSALLLAGGVLACRGETRGLSRSSSASARLLFWGLLFVLQASVCYFAYFMPGWDANVILRNAYYIAGHPNPEYLYPEYFSFYPNNILMTELFAAVFRAFRSVAGDAGLDLCAYILVVCQCALNAATGCLVCRIAERITDSAPFTRLVGAVYVAFIGIQPWVMIPYSDSLSLILPALLLYLFVQPSYPPHTRVAAAAMGALAGFGFLIKPQNLIALLAILIVLALRALSGAHRQALTCAAAALLALCAVLGPVKGVLYDRSLIESDPEQCVGAAHFLMMGLNEETAGVYSDEDVERSIQIQDRQERTRMQLETAKARILEMGPSGLIAHLTRKTLVNFGDGTFGWGNEGHFILQEIEDKDARLSPFLKSILYPGAPRHPAYATWLHALWLGLLVGSLALPFCRARDEAEGDALCVIALSLIGLTLFEALFEARARYLYCYAPYFLLAGLCGWRRVAQRLCALRRVRR